MKTMSWVGRSASHDFPTTAEADGWLHPLLSHALMLRLRELLARRRQLVIMITAEKQRLAKAADKLAQRSFKTILRSLEAERARIDRAIDKLIGQSPCSASDRIR